MVSSPFYPNHLPLNSAMNGRYMMLLKKTPATGGAARKELTLLARTLNLKPPLWLVLGRIMSPESCQRTRQKTNPEARSNE
jgi:hypothetical protein